MAITYIHVMLYNLQGTVMYETWVNPYNNPRLGTVTCKIIKLNNKPGVNSKLTYYNFSWNL